MHLFPSSDETIHGVAEALRKGGRTCVSIVEGCLQQIDIWEPRLRAWVSVDRSGALRRARELDADLAAGRDRGPLHGIPLGIKDLIDVAGWPTAAGSALLANEIATADAPLVNRLREAGAIILGKTVTTQFACFDPSVTCNPWNVERTPGGSSSGSATAVATGMCLGAVGSQTGGSITRPASFCGVAGCKPTFGLIPTAGVYPVSHSLDHPGPIARSVADLALLMEVLADQTGLDSAPSLPPHIGRLHGMFDEKTELAMRQAFESTCRILAAAGAHFGDAVLPDSFRDVLSAHRQIMLYELGEVHRERFAAHPDDYLPGIRGLIEEAARIPDEKYKLARSHQNRLRMEIAGCFQNYDVLICPATLGPAPDLSTTGDPSFNAPWSYTGLPTVSFPIALSPDGLPLAIQLIGRADGEASLFQAARWCENIVRRDRA
ncbi:MAG TPA: amidase [Planctomycetaceae bacterium]|nr:amidase [Planctomycetaceae bacterium]